MMTRIISNLQLVALFVMSTNVCAQTSDYQVNLPQLLPASPEASLFVKAGIGNVNRSTGAATANIPLYTIKIKNFEFPISLSYSTQGLRVDEASSRVGYNWVLNASGMITRKVHGEVDEFAAQHQLPSTDFSVYSDAMFNFLLNSTTPGNGFDTQPDEFQFNVNGYSGKFVLDYNSASNSYTPRMTSTSNVKISMIMSVTPGSTSGGISTITLTTPDGIIYRFGSSEVSTDNNLELAHSINKLNTKTAFFLDQITLTTGEQITFNYIPISTKAFLGITQTLVIGVKDQGLCATCPNTFLTTNMDRATYATKYLSSITTTTGLNIDLTYAPRVDDSQDIRLIGLNVEGIKQFSFEYYDSPNQENLLTGRFFLTKVSDITLGTASTKRMDYVLSYEQIESAPLPESFEQDHLGYFNGNNLRYFIPQPIAVSDAQANSVDFSFRNPNSNFSKIGTLTKILYPTGGTEEFLYEGNTQVSYILRTPTDVYGLSSVGAMINGSETQQSFTNSSITVPFDQDVTIIASTIANNNASFDSSHVGMSFQISGGIVNTSHSIIGAGTYTTTVHLLASTQYTARITGYQVGLSAQLLINYSSSPPYYDTVNTEIPGVRLRQIRYTDPITSNTHSKYFTYASRLKLNRSSGSAFLPMYQFSNIWKSYCGGGTYPVPDVCTVYTYSSSSSSQVYNYAGSGSLIYYTNVIESDDPGFVNGGTEYVFYPNDDGYNYATVYNNPIQYLSSGQNPTLSGAIDQTNHFDKNYKLVETEENIYGALIFIDHQITSVYVRKSFDSWTYNTDGLTRYEGFDVSSCTFNNTWIRLVNKVITHYDQGALTQVTTYYYGSPVNILPDSVVTTDSGGNRRATKMQYPNTFPNSFLSSVYGYDALTAKNNISQAVRQVSYVNRILQQQKIVYYKDWFSNGSIVEPLSIQVQETSDDPLHEVILFDQYSTQGNPTQFHKANDMIMSYLWDETLSRPIAEIKNATAGQVAFTGFENNAMGNWSLVGTPTYGMGMVGRSSLNGSVQMTLALNGTYQVSLWTNGTAPLVNNNIGTLMKSARGWNLYQWTLVNPTQVTVNSNGSLMDEVRLCPAGSMMETFTYEPFIGLTGRSDVNNNFTYFTYDGMGRLILVNDKDGNIVKDYHYYYMTNKPILP